MSRLCAINRHNLLTITQIVPRMTLRFHRDDSVYVKVITQRYDTFFNGNTLHVFRFNSSYITTLAMGRSGFFRIKTCAELLHS